MPIPCCLSLSAALVLGAGHWTTTLTSVPQDALGARTPASVKTAEAEMCEIDAVHSMALFRVRHLGAGAFWGRFNTVTGTIEYVEDSDDDLKIEVVIDTTSVDSGSDGLDRHLKSPDFFGVEEHPKATFKSTRVRRLEGRMYEVGGDLTMKGVTKPVRAKVEWLGSMSGQRGKRSGFEATFTVKRSDFGIDYGVANGALGDETRIIVAMEAVVATAGQPARGEGGGGRRGNFMDRLDTNKDGKLQKDELPERLRDRFDDIDTNDDGAIDEDEMRAMRGGRGGGVGGGEGGRGGGAGTGTGGGGGGGGGGR